MGNNTNIVYQKSSYDYNSRIANMTDDEKNKCLELTKNINVHDLSTLTEFGSELSNAVAENSDRLLSTIKVGEDAGISELTNDLLKELNMISTINNEINSSNPIVKYLSRIPLINKLVKTVDNIKIKYNSIAENVNEIEQRMCNTKLIALRDNSNLQELFDNNVAYIERIRELIVAAKVYQNELTNKLDEIRNDSTREIFEVNELSNFINSLNKKIVDMEVTENVLQQNLLQIKATQGNNIALIENSNNIVTNVIPLWKNQLVLSKVIKDQEENVKAHQLIADTTNRILTENAKTLHTNSVNIARANEESVITVETINKTTNELINTVNDVIKIHNDGIIKRKQIEAEIGKMGEQLHNALKNDIAFKSLTDESKPGK